MDERTPKELIRLAVGLSGRSEAEVSKALGKNPRYLSNLLNSPSSPSVDLCVRVLDECGVSLVASGHGLEARVRPSGE